LKLDKYRDEYLFASSKASDVARQLAFAGIAIIWIFKIGEVNKSFEIPLPLVWAALFLCVTLGADLLQYAIASATWGLFFIFKEKEYNKQGIDPYSVDLSHSRNLRRPIYVLFWLKLVTVIIGYIFIGYYIANILPRFW